MKMRPLLAARLAGIAVVAAVTTGVGRVAEAQVAPAAPDTVPVGDWQLAPVVDLRLRGEYGHTLFRSNGEVLGERARLGVDVTRNALEARAVLQIAGESGVGAGPDAPPPDFDHFLGAHELWIDGHTDSVHPSFLRAGRQAVSWGEGRLLGVSDWSTAGRTLDAVRGRVVAGDGAFELLAAALLPPRDEGGFSTPYAELFGARAEWAFDPLFAVELYGLARIAQNEPFADANVSVTGQTYTGAARLHGDAAPWAWGVEGAYQLGHADPLEARRAAWAAAGHVAFTFERLLGDPTLRLGGSYASGETSAAQGATYTAFDPLLPDVHTWHGAMDLFSWSNEVEGSARLTVTPFTDALAWVEYRYARMARPEGSWRTAYLVTLGRDGRNTDANLGSEIDASLRWSPWAPLALEAGYSVLFVGGGARAALTQGANEARFGNLAPELPGSSVADVSHFAYAQATLTFP